MTIGSLVEVYQEALRVATMGNGPKPKEPEQTLDILFYGMMCFDPLENRSGYRVLFPNGVDLPDLVDIPVHAAGVWVRDRSVSATTRWSGLAFRNDFFVSEQKTLTITGLVKTPLNTDEFDGRVTNLQKCEPTFQIADAPDAVIEMTVDRGTLSAHKINGKGMIVVKWTVQVEAGLPVRFTFGNDFIEIPASVKQVFLANVSASAEESMKHFQLYRKLAKDPSKPLGFKLPEVEAAAASTLELNDPTFGYTPSEAADITPDVVCSAVVSRLLDPLQTDNDPTSPMPIYG